MLDLGPLLKVCGVAIAGMVVETGMIYFGHGDKRGLARITTYLACAGLVITEVLDAARSLAAMFGVYF